ncbi:hypothetical protein [Nonomuraea sp. NPDC050643]|uniref:hypothetical protein n=1 Tax=Nonomuraea sp. NPDC050643 TaxID=3155660 RepID=UPI0033DF317C
MPYLGTALALTAVLAAPPAQPPVGELPGTNAEVVAKMGGRPVQLTSYAGFLRGRPGSVRRA